MILQRFPIEKPIFLALLDGFWRKLQNGYNEQRTRRKRQKDEQERVTRPDLKRT